MALINCPECGGQVSDSAVSCPHCGYSLTNLKHCEDCNAVITENDAVCPQCGCPTPWSRKCPECGNYVLAPEEKCPECGFDMVSHYGRVNTVSTPKVKGGDNNSEEYEYYDEYEKQSSKKKWWLLGGTLLVVAVLTCSLIWIGKNPTMKCEINKEITITAQDTTEKCEIMSAEYRSGEGYNCGTFFLAMIRDFRPSAFIGTPDYSLVIKSSKLPSELREGEVISDSYLSYYNYAFANNGLAKSKEGSVVVKKKTRNKITLDFKNFNFLVDPTDERFGLNGTITFSYKEGY